MTGEGIDEFLNAVQDARQEYETEYKPELDRLVEERVGVVIIRSPSCLPYLADCLRLWLFSCARSNHIGSEKGSLEKGTARTTYAGYVCRC